MDGTCHLPYLRLLCRGLCGVLLFELWYGFIAVRLCARPCRDTHPSLFPPQVGPGDAAFAAGSQCSHQSAQLGGGRSISCTPNAIRSSQCTPNAISVVARVGPQPLHTVGAGCQSPTGARRLRNESPEAAPACGTGSRSTPGWHSWGAEVAAARCDRAPLDSPQTQS